MTNIEPSQLQKHPDDGVDICLTKPIFKDGVTQLLLMSGFLSD